MKKEIVLLDLFSGIGGFPKGLEEAGFTITDHYFSEIDKHAIANYRHNFKNANYVGSVTDVRGSQLPKRPNIITFGSPCQDFSLAGNVLVCKEQEVVLSVMPLDLSPNADRTYLSGKTLKELSPQTMARTFGQLSRPLPTLGAIDLNGNCLIQHGYYPKIESEFTLSDILEKDVNETYFLSEKSLVGLMKGQSKPEVLEP